MYLVHRIAAPDSPGGHGHNFANPRAAADWATSAKGTIAFKIALSYERTQPDWSPFHYVGWRMTLDEIRALGPQAAAVASALVEQGRGTAILATSGDFFLDGPDPSDPERQPVQVVAPAPPGYAGPRPHSLPRPAHLYLTAAYTAEGWRRNRLTPEAPPRPLPVPRPAVAPPRFSL